MGFLGDDVSNLKILDFSLRFVVIPFNVASIWITMTNHQDNIIYGNLDFDNFLVLKYMVCINAVSAGYALFAAASSWITCLVTKAWLFFVTDQVSMLWLKSLKFPLMKWLFVDHFPISTPVEEFYVLQLRFIHINYAMFVLGILVFWRVWPNLFAEFVLGNVVYIWFYFVPFRRRKIRKWNRIYFLYLKYKSGRGIQRQT